MLCDSTYHVIIENRTSFDNIELLNPIIEIFLCITFRYKVKFVRFPLKLLF